MRSRRRHPAAACTAHTAPPPPAAQDPSAGLESETEVEVSSHNGDAEKLARMADALLLEHESLLRFMTTLDVERLAEACEGWGTDDTHFIQCITTRSKRYLTRVSMLYRFLHKYQLEQLIDKEISVRRDRAEMRHRPRSEVTGDAPDSPAIWARPQGMYALLAKYMVLPEVQADVRLLTIAVGGSHNKKGFTAGTKALVEFLCARHPRRIRAAKVKWEGKHDTSLVDRLHDLLDGDARKLGAPGHTPRCAPRCAAAPLMGTDVTRVRTVCSARSAQGQALDQRRRAAPRRGAAPGGPSAS